MESRATSTANAGGRGVRRVLVAVVALSAVLFVLLAIDVSDDRGTIAGVDRDVAAEMHDVFDDRPTAVDVLQAITFFGTSFPLYAVVVGVAVYALRTRRTTLAALMLLATTTGGLANHFAKDIVGRDRPSFADPIDVGGGPAFPSGHAMNSAIAFGVVVLAVWIVRRRRAAIVATIAAACVGAIGFIRVALGVHYVSDVIGGWLLAAVWVGLTALVAEHEVAASPSASHTSP
jgi:undecaprenyl-diphosphatase